MRVCGEFQGIGLQGASLVVAQPAEVNTFPASH